MLKIPWIRKHINNKKPWQKKLAARTTTNTDRGRPLRLFTDCCGMECIVFAFIAIALPFIQLGACDNSRAVKRFWEANFKKSKAHENCRWFDDIFNRDMNEIVSHVNKHGGLDVYASGFPCQSFSSAGSGAGTNTREGTIVYQCIKFIDVVKPKTFLLENVTGLLTEHPEELADMINKLKTVNARGYNVSATIMNSLDHGIPQNRSRLYIVGVRKDCQKKQFEFPPAIGHVPISLIHDPLNNKKVFSITFYTYPSIYLPISLSLSLSIYIYIYIYMYVYICIYVYTYIYNPMNR